MVISTNPSFLDGEKFIKQPLQRILDKMKDIEIHFPTDATLKAAIVAMEYLIQSGTGSGVERHLTPDLHRNWDMGEMSVYISDLKGSDCIFAMALSNRVGPISEDECARLSISQSESGRPILTQIIDAAFRGSYIVVQYCKNGYVLFDIPQDLRSFRQQVYVELGEDT